MPSEFASSLFFVGRLLLGGAFVFAGLRNLTNIPALTGLLAGRGVPQARLTLCLGIAWQVVCGILLVSGPWIAWAAVGLIAFLLVATPIFNNFWDYQGIDRGNRINGWVSNVALAGAFLAVIASAPVMAENATRLPKEPRRQRQNRMIGLEADLQAAGKLK